MNFKEEMQFKSQTCSKRPGGMGEGGKNKNCWAAVP